MAFKDAHCSDSPSELAREYNLRSPGQKISIGCARKWLLGLAIPRQERLRILSQLLDVSLKWLRFGDGGEWLLGGEGGSMRAVVADFRSLSHEQKMLALEFVRLLVRTGALVRQEDQHSL